MSGVAQNPIQHLSFPQPQEKCELGQSLRIAICIRALLAGQTGWSGLQDGRRSAQFQTCQTGSASGPRMCHQADQAHM